MYPIDGAKSIGEITKLNEILVQTFIREDKLKERSQSVPTSVRALCKQQGGVAFLLPPFEKSDLFKGIVMGGVLPRKTFSMGHAEEKRYYIECRKIKE